jgi:hypothetical protein
LLLYILGTIFYNRYDIASAYFLLGNYDYITMVIKNEAFFYFAIFLHKCEIKVGDNHDTYIIKGVS